MRRRRWCVHAALGVNSAVPAVRPYTVRKGDTVETIVKKRGVFQCVCGCDARARKEDGSLALALARSRS